MKLRYFIQAAGLVATLSAAILCKMLLTAPQQVEEIIEIQPVEIVRENSTKIIENSNRFILEEYLKKLKDTTSNVIALQYGSYVNVATRGVVTEYNREDFVRSVTCLAKNIYHESRSEPIRGQVAVALVTYNRVNHQYYPNTVCDVVYQKSCNKKRCVGQFSWTVNPNTVEVKKRLRDKSGKIIQSEVNAWVRAVYIAIDVITNCVPDITSGAMHYYNYKIANPAWATSNRFVPVSNFQNGKLGDHRFLIDTHLVK